MEERRVTDMVEKNVDQNSQCKIVEDLLPLYTEGMCSEETQIYLEEHIAACASCREKKRNYEKNIEDMIQAEQQERMEEAEKEIQPMKKVKRKMRKNQWLIRVLVLLLIILVGKLAMMTYGQLHPGTFTNFEMLTERHQVRKVLDQMCRGNFEPFLKCIDYNPEEYLLVVAEDGESNDRRTAGEIMQTSVEKVFRGKEIELVDDVEVNYVWVNGENIRCELVIEAHVLVDGELLEFSFTQKGNGHYDVLCDAADSVSEYAGFSNTLWYVQHRDMGTLPLWALTQNVDEAYEAMLEGEKEDVRKELQDVSRLFSSPTNQFNGGNEEYSQQIEDSLYGLYEENIYLKEICAKIASFDTDVEKEKLELVFVFENQSTGELIMFSEEFQDGSFYEVTDKPVTVQGNISPEVKQELLSLFH